MLAQWQPDCIVLFGQARLYHKIAIERARAMDVPVVVMEEGYFRPGYVTMELGGVNAYSTTLDRFQWIASVENNQPLGYPTDLSRIHFQKMAWHASNHYIAMRQQSSLYPQYVHHRDVDPETYARYWVRSWVRKVARRSGDRKVQRWLINSRQPYFFVPLQLEGDSQLTHHSGFAGNCQFIFEVLTSFKAHAPAGSLLVFRQHPHARGGPGHAAFIRGAAEGLGIGARVRHLVEGDTPDLAEHALGTVVINSTVGLQTLERGAPLIALGEALYDRPGLTFQGPLDQFWSGRTRPDPSVARAFLAQLKHLTQAPCSVYALRSEPLLWSSLLQPRV
ncbi:MAG: capsular biosynthesis protein [Ramlibacter sp.]|nr:capsular biosynthesis protein [Ramlibacter sp.]